MGEAYTENCAGRRVFAAPESWYSFEIPIEIDEGFNSERGRATYMGKDLTGVRSPQRKLMPDTVESGKHKPTSLRGIAKVTAHGVVSAEASTTEEPREGKLHAGICAGGAG